MPKTVAKYESYYKKLMNYFFKFSVTEWQIIVDYLTDLSLTNLLVGNGVKLTKRVILVLVTDNQS